MKIQVFYTFHRTRKAESKHETSFTFEAETDVADELLEVATPFYFDDIRNTRRQLHLSKLTYWHAAMHYRYIMRSDQILKVERA